MFHFTAAAPGWAGSILAGGVIKTTESNAHPSTRHYGPPCVWLTNDPDPEASAVGLKGAGGDKLAARFVLELPSEEVMSWAKFAKQQRISKRWRRALEEGRASNSWFLILRPVVASEMVALDVKPNMMQFADVLPDEVLPDGRLRYLL